MPYNVTWGNLGIEDLAISYPGIVIDVQEEVVEITTDTETSNQTKDADTQTDQVKIRKLMSDYGIVSLGYSVILLEAPIAQGSFCPSFQLQNDADNRKMSDYITDFVKGWTRLLLIVPCQDICLPRDKRRQPSKRTDWKERINNRHNPYICLGVERFPQDSAEDTSGFEDDNISEVHISSIEGEEYCIESLPIPPRQNTVPLEVTEEGIDVFFEESGDAHQDAPGEGYTHRPPQDDQQDAPGQGCAHRPPQDDQQNAPGGLYPPATSR
ncbi:unnamed protein product [Mytilus coruscus]|uniref:Uncharacterized protein n=1 Tax=Mytilus coruscus TaxID=42192 RepID=A0A6J8ADZ0_MYTCO|nr:unnamed protein product [Mytilus coruscus]